MITLNLKTENGDKKLMVKEDVLFNAILSKHPIMIKRLIKSLDLLYKINMKEFMVINQFIDFLDNGVSIYPGLIVKTDKLEFAVLYLEGTKIDENHMIEIIKKFVIETEECEPTSITINRFEIDKGTFLHATEQF